MVARLIMKMMVLSRHVEGETAVFRLMHPRRPQLPLWVPGAHVELHLPNGKRRAYSLCSIPDDLSYYEIAVKREEGGRGGSKWIVDNLQPGDIVPVGAPRSFLSLSKAPGRHVLLAGGIGITPFIPMGWQALQVGQDVELTYCTRTKETAPLLARATKVFGKALDLRVTSENSFDAAGFVAQLSTAGIVHLYVCGSPRLIAAVRDAAISKGWPAERLHVESFASQDDEFIPKPFEVRINSTGQMLHVPAEKSVLQVLIEQGFDILQSCRIGVCGSCECTYSSGDVIHRDQILSQRQKGTKLMTCVSRGRGMIELDI